MSSPDSTPHATADVSVRIAWADDADAIAGLQLRVWADVFGEVIPTDRGRYDAQREAVARTWRASLQRPGDARNRVLVALDRARVVGFAITTPAGDPDCDPIADGELQELAVDPDQRGRGHGSRLVQAAVDTMVADRFIRAVTWVGTTQDPLRGFLAASGWAPDAAHRELATEGPTRVVTRQVRLHTALA